MCLPDSGQLKGTNSIEIIEWLAGESSRKTTTNFIKETAEGLNGDVRCGTALVPSGSRAIGEFGSKNSGFGIADNPEVRTRSAFAGIDSEATDALWAHSPVSFSACALIGD